MHSDISQLIPRLEAQDSTFRPRASAQHHVYLEVSLHEQHFRLTAQALAICSPLTLHRRPHSMVPPTLNPAPVFCPPIRP
jgi:hypothetical protein